MHTIKLKLLEYDIRFFLTDKIKEDTYPFFKNPLLNKSQEVVKITPYHICNKQGKVEIKGQWATADIIEEPSMWVVEKDETHPMWEKFCDSWVKGDKEHERMIKDYTYFSSNSVCCTSILSFEKHQYLTLDQWAEFFLPKVDFSIMNDVDWLYIENKIGNKYLVKGANIVNDTVYFDSHYDVLNGFYYMDKKSYLIKDQFKTLRKATPEDLAPLFEKYPELAPPKVGDWGIFWDGDEYPRFTISTLRLITDMDDKYPYCAMIGRWEHFHKIDPLKALLPQVGNFKNLQLI